MRYFCLFLVVVLAPVCAMAQPLIHSADQNDDYVISLTEMLRVTQLHNLLGHHCDPTTEDGYAPGWIITPPDCTPHSSDYNPTNWRIELGELLRIIQFFNIGGYHVCVEGEDGFCPGLGGGIPTFTLENWLGYPESEATVALQIQSLLLAIQTGINPGLRYEISYQYDDVVPEGVVLGQEPGAGLRQVGSTVHLIVSLGPDPNPKLFGATLETTDPDTTYSVGEFGHFLVSVSNGVPPYEIRVGWPDAGLQIFSLESSGGEVSISQLFDADTGGESLPLQVRVTDSSATPQVLNLSLPIQVDPAPVP